MYWKNGPLIYFMFKPENVDALVDIERIRPISGVGLIGNEYLVALMLLY